MYSLLQYFLLSTEEEIKHTYYFWGEAISDPVSRYFERQSVDIFRLMDTAWKEKKISSPYMEEYFYHEFFPTKNILQVDYAGQEEQCRVIHLTGISKTDYITPGKVSYSSLEKMWNTADEGKKDLINTIYAFQKDQFNYLDKKRILLTQPLSEDSLMSEKEKMRLFSRITDYIGRDNLVIKKHPRDVSNYECCNVESININIPLQLLSLNGITASPIVL